MDKRPEHNRKIQERKSRKNSQGEKVQKTYKNAAAPEIRTWVKMKWTQVARNKPLSQ